jgi:two-component system copper resistance phosphate regulon response regulator CusR
LGADDYVAKPFSPGEILARIKAVLRRTSGSPQTRDPLHNETARLMRIGDLELDLHRRRASRAGRSLGLTPKEFPLLSLLAHWRGKVLSRPFIAEQIWDTSLEKTTNVVNVHIRRLRSKLDDPFGQKLVTTVRGVGYMLSDNASASAESLGT